MARDPGSALNLLDHGTRGLQTMVDDGGDVQLTPGDATARSPEASHTALEDLLAVIAHEMRAPLTVVCTAAETIATGHLTDEQLGPLLQVIRRNAELAMLLTDRLGLARDVEVGAFDPHAVELDLAAVAAETVGDLAPSIAERHLVRVVAQRPVRVVAGETSLREILLNLLLNAAKYSPAGSEIEVTVALENGEAVLAVRDHGPGVDPADTERIFGKYTQVDRMSAGVGLGLYISRGLARANGGDLTVETPMGGGSVFTLRLAAAPTVPDLSSGMTTTTTGSVATTPGVPALDGDAGTPSVDRSAADRR